MVDNENGWIDDGERARAMGPDPYAPREWFVIARCETCFHPAGKRTEADPWVHLADTPETHGHEPNVKR